MESDSSQNTTKHSGTENLRAELPEYSIYKQPQKSEWRVWLMGDYGKSEHGAIVYQPNKGMEPNWFHRIMQELCFGFQWRKGP